MNQPTFLIIDLFCGFGGTTLGYDRALIDGEKVAKVIACVNHDPKAINSHFLNHPDVLHFTEDIRTLELGPLVELVRKARIQYPDAYVVLWASLECTNHSKAKGGLPRDADSRTLANDLFRYQEALDPDFVKIENVVEFMAWGPLDANNKPISRKNGQEWVKWRAEMCSRGYYDEWRELNSANFGAYTSRNRLFGCFAKHGLPITWPEPTHSKKIRPGMFGSLKPWKAVKDVLKMEDEGESIFTRKKLLCDNTLDVIYKGLIKALNEGKDSILFKYYGNGANLNSVEMPCGTIPTKDRFAKLQFIFRQYKTGFSSSVQNPMGTLPTNPKANLVTFILNKSYGGNSHSIEKPSPVIIARQDKEPLYLIQALMDENGIVDIKMRMLMVAELLKIQGFPEKYHMVGNQSDHKKFIGNSVVPDVVKAWAEAMAKRLLINFQKQA
jgi:DNA (cytosine-5)-methyltransferase 1